MKRDPEPVLRVEGVHRAFSGCPVLRGVDLTVGHGEIVVLVGGSGSGKTTLLRIVAGLERVQSGDVHLRGQPVDGQAARRFKPPEERGLGMVFQEPALWPHLTVAENVAIALPRGTVSVNHVAVRLLEAVELALLADRRPATLSGGQKQRVALARALATGSDLLLLDEPLSSLDEMVRARLRPLIRHTIRNQGRSALFVSHDRQDAWHLADRIGVLEEGIVSQVDTPRLLYAAPATAMVARYMGAAGHVPIRGLGSGQVALSDGRVVPAVSAGLATGAPGVALAYPDGISIASHGLPARRLDQVFEAGRWRIRWRLEDSEGELYSLHDQIPPEQAGLVIDARKLFAFPER